MRGKPNDKLFIVRKYVWAKDVSQAVIREKRTPVDDVWLDDDWKKLHPHMQGDRDSMGFSGKKKK